jgi:hypothetical protein
MALIRKIFLNLILLLFCAPLFSIQFELLNVEVWCELEPFVGGEETQYPLSKDKAAEQILKEARFIISGMIYGFSFSYIPSDKAKGVKEQFILTPLAEIPWGDKNLEIITSEENDKKLFAKVQYELEDFQISRRNAWLSTGIPTATGRGEGNLFKSYREKITSYKQAIKEAIRNLLRPKLFNKPRQVKGQALIVDAPQIFITAGKYVSSIKVKLKIQEVVPYTVF